MKKENYKDVIEYNKQDIVISIDSNVWFYTLPYKESNKFFISLIYNGYTEFDFIEDFIPQKKPFKPLKFVNVYFSDCNIITIEYTTPDHKKSINMECSKIPNLYNKYINHERQKKTNLIKTIFSDD